MSTPGMMSDADMTHLGNATSATFDRLWVQMIKHHQGALSMAKTSGLDVDVKAVDLSITTS